MFVRRRDMYVRDDGELLIDKQASDERKRSIAKRKAEDLLKLLQNRKYQSNKTKRQKSAVGVSATALASASGGHASALNAHAKGVNVSASATAEPVRASALNANATGLNASASASATAVHANALNANATGANISASATANGVNVAVGNVGVTGVDAAASASASLAKVQVGNIDVNGASAGVSAKVNGLGVSTGNVAIGGPSAAASVSVDGSLSFGNINFGLRPSLDIGVGFNLGIPFLSGSKMGSKGNNGGSSGQQGDGQDQNPGALEKAQDYLSSKFPNQRIYKTPVDVNMRPNKDGQAIDPLLPNNISEQTNVDNPAVNEVIQQHNKLVEDGMKFVGFKGCPPDPPSSNNQPDPDWEGMYTSPNPSVAGGYVGSADGQRTGEIKRIYVPNDAGKIYYTKKGLDTPEARIGVQKIKEHSDGKYMFSGPQDSYNPDCFAPELVISPAIRDEAKANGNLKFENSAHTVNLSSRRFEEYHQGELEHSKIIPDYLVDIKTAADCAKAGGRERLAHVFHGQSPLSQEQEPLPLTAEDQLLLEECQKLGIQLTSVQLNYWKKQLKSDAEYEREEDLRNSTNSLINSSQQNGISQTNDDDEDLVTEPPQPCRNHPPNVRCMKCMQSSSGLRIRQVHNNIHGFSHQK